MRSPGTAALNAECSFHECLQDAPIACHELDLSGRVVRVNRAECDLLGIQPGDILGKPIWEFVSAEERELSRSAVERKLSGVEPPGCFERPYIRSDGTQLVIQIWDTLLRAEDGRIVGLRSFLLDLTEHRRFEQALQEGERRLRHFVENARDIMYHADLHGRFTFVNPTVATVLRCSPESLIGCHYLDLIRSDWRPAAHRFYRKQLIHRVHNTYYEFPAVARDGSEVWFGQNVQLVFENGRVSGFQAVARDITDRKRAEQQLERVHAELEARVAERTADLARANESLRREMEERRSAETARRRLVAKMQEAQRLESLGFLAGGLAHDYNNLLTTILGYCSLAQANIHKNSPAVAHIETVQKAANRAAEITAQMLAYAGKGNVAIKRVCISSLIEQMQPFLESATSKSAQLEVCLAHERARIDADPGQIRQVLVNLVSNASDALGDKPGVITVRTGTTQLDPERLSRAVFASGGEGPHVFVEVSDTGSGMDHETRPKIFDPFFSTKFVGRGLGLAAVQGIVRAHRGAIEMETAPGRGSTFRILLPVAGAVARKAQENPQQVLGWRSSGLVLVAEDDPRIQELVQAVLERTGFTVIAARDGVAAIETIRASADHLTAAIVDLTMPKAGGDEVLAELHRLRPGLPAILCSGHSKAALQAAGSQFASVKLLSKPYEPEQMLAALRAALTEHR